MDYSIPKLFIHHNLIKLFTSTKCSTKCLKETYSPESCLIEVEKERTGRLGKAEQRAVVVVAGRRGKMAVVAAMEAEFAIAAYTVVAIAITVRTKITQTHTLQ